MSMLYTRQTKSAVAAAFKQVDRADWDACATGGNEVNPFLLWDFLNALEESQSAVRPDTSLSFDI